MNLSPSALLVVIVATVVANILILLTVVMKSRADRARRYVDVGGYLSSSYADRFEASTVEPFEYPAPTSLEQRSFDLDDQVDEVESTEADQAVAADDAADTNAAGDADADDDQHDGEVDVDDANTEERPASAEVTTIPRAESVEAQRGRDGLTGLLDAMAFGEALEHEDARQQRYGRPATVIVFELDGLAKLVERLGSDPGDRIEAALGDAIKRLARRADYVARLERGRYSVLLPETDEVAAINYVERIRRACDLWLESSAIAMRLAIGWASTTGDATLEGAIRLATERMRVEQRRNARGVGDESGDLDALDAAESLEDAVGL